jgi:hypothetical protein
MLSASKASFDKPFYNGNQWTVPDIDYAKFDTRLLQEQRNNIQGLLLVPEMK